MNLRDARARALWPAILAGLVFSGAAQADLLSSVDVQLIAHGGDVSNPGSPYSLSQLVAPADGVHPGDGTAIGGYMLDAEFIEFSGNSIRLRVATGDDAGGVFTTGYLGLNGEHARYLFNGLSIAGQTIVAINVYAFDGFATAGFSGIATPSDPNSYVRLLNASSLSVDLDSLIFKGRGNGSSNNYGDLRIDLLATPVPEPGTAGLMLAGGALLAMSLRRRPQP